MGLAAPVAMMVGCGRAAALGIFIRSGDVLERLAKVDGVVFDKTGTLTERHAEVTLVAAGAGSIGGEVLSLAAAVEAESEHPIAVAIAAARRAAPGPRRPVRYRARIGVAGMVDGHRVEVEPAGPRAAADPGSAARSAERYRPGRDGRGGRARRRR